MGKQTTQRQGEEFLIKGKNGKKMTQTALLTSK